MSKKAKKQPRVNDPAEYISPLTMNGLEGRVLRMPAPKGKKKEILFVYGHHSSIERWWGVMQDLNQYGAVTMPDLPGFGGMDSFYKIGKKPNVDSLADYLASFVKMRYKRKKVTVIGLSFGFVVITRMLQKYPDLAKRIDNLVSVVGFAHHSSFKFSGTRMNSYRLLTRVFSRKIPAFVFQKVCLNPASLRFAYAKTRNAKHKFDLAQSQEDFDKLMDFEIVLWRKNDVRTHMRTNYEMLTVDNCNKQIDLPLYHVYVGSDGYFNNDVVLEHLKVIFSKVKAYKSNMPGHSPSVIADMEEAMPLIPSPLRRILAKK